MKILRNMKGANTETKVVYKNVTKIDVVCKKNVAKKIRNGLKPLVSKTDKPQQKTTSNPQTKIFEHS